MCLVLRQLIKTFDLSSSFSSSVRFVAKSLTLKNVHPFSFIAEELETEGLRVFSAGDA